MSEAPIYLDYNATTPVAPEVAAAIRLMWSAKTGPDIELVFRQTFLLKGACHEEKAVFGRADSCGTQAGRTGDTREALAIDVGVRLRGEHVVETLNRLVMEHGKPRFLFADNGAEFTGCLMDMWAYHHGTRIDFSRPGKPTDNAFIESFNGSLRDECLNIHWFESIDHAKSVIERWRVDYNESRPHMAFGNIPPRVFARRAGNSKDRQDP